jgi:histidinol-phosphatase (PHP family)
VVLGSVHWLGAWLFDAYGNPDFAAEWQRRPVDDVWDLYVDALVDLARSGRVDVIAHVDVVKVAGYRPRDVDRFEDRLGAAIAATGVAIEVSSAGLRKPAQELYPSPRLLGLLHAAGVALTTASDAHLAEQIGYRFDDVYASLRQLGVAELVTFDRRRPRAVPI